MHSWILPFVFTLQPGALVEAVRSRQMESTPVQDTLANDFLILTLIIDFYGLNWRNLNNERETLVMQGSLIMLVS